MRENVDILLVLVGNCSHATRAGERLWTYSTTGAGERLGHATRDGKQVVGIILHKVVRN